MWDSNEQKKDVSTDTAVIKWTLSSVVSIHQVTEAVLSMRSRLSQPQVTKNPEASDGNVNPHTDTNNTWPFHEAIWDDVMRSTLSRPKIQALRVPNPPARREHLLQVSELCAEIA